MSKSKPKPMSLDIEVTHLRPLEDTNGKTIEELSQSIGKELKQKLRKNDENINTIELKGLSIGDNVTNLRNYYEESGVFRLTGSLEFSYVLRKRELLKKSLAKICTNTQFRNTLFSLNEDKLNAIKYLSNISHLITHQTFKKINSFGLGSITDLTQFIEHYSSDRMHPKMNVAKDDITADFEHDKKRLMVRFRLTTGGQNGKYMKNIRYKLEYEYQAINSAIVSVDTNSMRIYLTLNHPPILFKVAVDDMTPTEKADYERQNQWIDPRKRYYKQKTFKTIESNKGVHNNEVQNWEKWIREQEFVGCSSETIGKSNVVALDIPLIRDESKLVERYREVADPFRVLYLMKRFSKTPIYFACIERHEGFANDSIRENLFNAIDVPFPIEYAYHSVFSHTFQSSDELLFKNQTKEFNEKVEEFSRIDPKATEDTLFELSNLIDRSAIFCTINALKHIFNDKKKMNEKIEKIDIKSFKTEIEYIRRCILTPTRFLILPPQPTLSSRFIANSDPEYTIRLSVREDDLRGLQFSIRMLNINQNSFLLKVIKEPLMKGIPIGNRLFEFLGSSSSQLRDTGMILYAKDEKGRTAQSIRESIGDMSKISKNVAKYVARLGLAFSQVMTHIKVNKHLTEVEDDIELGVKVNETLKPIKKLNESGEEVDEKYCFSDGIGRVSVAIMERVYQKLAVECRHRPSAMQIRYGGCKGMLVIDPNLKGEKIVFRNSMKKYESKAEILGIIKLSAPRPLYLNRQLVTILEQLGVEPKIFLKMLMDDLKNLANAMICECAATPLLQNSSTLCIPYRKLYNSGIPFLSEPLFRQIIDAVINHRLIELRQKARVKVPMSCGRTVFGVLDETGTLEYGQVFVQLSDVDADNMPNGSTTILKDEVMVTKFPCLHPGDVRKLTAVDVPDLHHIKDCIVFPQKGSRPHPDEMAGSDLDGDEYAVIWNHPLIFSNSNEKPMIFPTTDPILLEKDATVEDILNFYSEYIVGNNVGLLANAHLANADLDPDGIFSDTCMSLSRKYAVALDFAKTGRVETMEWNERPGLYPDFMEKFSQKRSYLSKNILGQLYRQTDRYNLGIQSNKNVEIEAKPNEYLALEGWQQYRQSAVAAYQAYKEKIIYLLNRFQVDNEAVLLSGAFSKTSKYMTGRTETNDVHELLENMINKLFIEFRIRFDDECKQSSSTEKMRALRASAWYMMPFEATDDIKDRYFGFSWTITEDICKLMKNCNKFKVNTEDHNCVGMATKLIDDYFERNYIYKEPEINPSQDEADRRQTIMERRCESAEVVLKAWLERQDHLRSKRKVGKRDISSTDNVWSDMDRKLRRKLISLRIELLDEAKACLDKPLKTAGHLVMSFLKQSVDEWLDIQTLDENNRIVDTPLVKFGYSALITLNHFFKTREISHIIYLGSTFKIALKASITDNTFFIPLPLPRRTPFKGTGRNGKSVGRKSKLSEEQRKEREEMIQKYVQYIVQYPEDFIERLKRYTGATEVCLEPYAVNTKQLQHYYLLTATGSVWALQNIKSMVCHPCFFRNVAERQLGKRKNLLCRGMPDFRTITPVLSNLSNNSV